MGNAIMQAESLSDEKVALVCDFDGTLIRTDSLHEALLALLKACPWLGLALPFILLLQGLLRFKQYVFARALPYTNAALFPLNKELLQALQMERSGGRLVHLISATPQFALEHFLKALELESLFDSVQGSDDKSNLKGSRKLAVIHEHFKGNFAYAGDCAVDLAIWRDAQCVEALLCGRKAAKLKSRLPSRLQQAARLYGADGAALQNTVSWWLKALRLHQWAKNALIFVPLFTAYLYTDPQALLSAVLAFVIFGCTASGTYILNDLLDLSADRVHPGKCQRPFACAALSITQGAAVAVLLLVGALGSSLYLQPPPFNAVLCTYLILTLAYSLRLKQLPMLDIVVLAVLYTLRVAAGCAALSIEASYWLLAFSIMIFLSLACLKRYTELQRKAGESGSEQVQGRGYLSSDADLVLGLGLTTFIASVLTLGLYINSPDLLVRYRAPELLWAVQLIFFYLIGRLWLIARRNHMHDDPVFFFVRDRVSLTLILISGCITLAAHHGLTFSAVPIQEALR